MELYLVQHGEATPKEVDPARPLTERGQVEVRRVAHAAHVAGVTVSTIYHSGKLRAQQTAEILAKELHVAEAPSSLEGLSNISLTPQLIMQNMQQHPQQNLNALL